MLLTEYDEVQAQLYPVGMRSKVEVAHEELFVNVCHYAHTGQDEPGTVQVSYAYGVNPSTITVEPHDKHAARPHQARMLSEPV
jgi:anti-sigma regulatory factor (Ser/Thr protein kinase)